MDTSVDKTLAIPEREAAEVRIRSDEQAVRIEPIQLSLSSHVLARRLFKSVHNS